MFHRFEVLSVISVTLKHVDYFFINMMLYSNSRIIRKYQHDNENEI